MGCTGTRADNGGGGFALVQIQKEPSFSATVSIANPAWVTQWTIIRLNLCSVVAALHAPRQLNYKILRILLRKKTWPASSIQFVDYKRNKLQVDKLLLLGRVIESSIAHRTVVVSLPIPFQQSSSGGRIKEKSMNESNRLIEVSFGYSVNLDVYFNICH